MLRQTPTNRPHNHGFAYVAFKHPKTCTNSYNKISKGSSIICAIIVYLRDSGTNDS